MSEQYLNHTNIDILLQKMGRKAVPQRMQRNTLVDPGELGGHMADAVELARRLRRGAPGFGGAVAEGLRGRRVSLPRIMLCRDKTIAGLARVHTADAIQALVEVCNNRTAHDRDRVAAANSLLAYGWGRPAPMQALQHSGPDGQPLPSGQGRGHVIIVQNMSEARAIADKLSEDDAVAFLPSNGSEVTNFTSPPEDEDGPG
jgi:hypothetical protein